MTEPNWLACGCGELSARVPCWQCAKAEGDRAAKALADELAARQLPKRFQDARIGSPELRGRVRYQGDLKTLSRSILGAANAIFTGPSGSGKTSLAVACLRERGGEGVYMPAFRLGVARIQAAAGSGEPAEVERAIKAPLLLLDELGAEALTATSAVLEVIFERYDHERPTWVTTGQTSQDLASRYGAGFLRRILDGGFHVRLG